MSEPLTEADLAAIEARAEAAKEGPWSAVWYNPERSASDGIWFVQYGPPDDPSDCFDLMEDPTKETAEFIANAKQDVPALIAEVRHLRAQLDAIHQHVIDLAVRRQQEDDG